MPEGKQPDRRPTDGPVGVTRADDDMITITATQDGVEHGLTMSEYNAWRIFGMLSVMLKIPLSAKVRKSIKIGGFEATHGPPPNATLGQKVAYHLAYGDRCHAAKDGECNWPRCPQLRDGEPQKSGRHCPIDVRDEDDCGQ